MDNFILSIENRPILLCGDSKNKKYRIFFENITQKIMHK